MAPAVLSAAFLTKAAVGFARCAGDYERFAPDIARGYRVLGLPGGRESYWSLHTAVARPPTGHPAAPQCIFPGGNETPQAGRAP